MTGRRLALAAAVLLAAPTAVAATLVVRGETVYPVSGPPIADGVVVVEDGKIAAVGPAAAVTVPAGAEELSAAVVTPGLVDAHTTVGLTGLLNQAHDQDQLERSEPVQPELRAIDAYNARDPLVDWVRDFGVTTVHTGHGPGELVSGQTMVVKLRGDEVGDNVLVPAAMVAASLGETAVHEEGSKPPGTRAKAIAMLRSQLLAAREYHRKLETAEPDKRPARDLRLETLVRVLDGELPLLVTVHRHHDILSALRLREEFGLRMVLDGAAEAYLVTDEIRAAGVPVVPHPPMARAVGELENATMELASRLAEAGIPFALQSGFESYVPKVRVLPFEAAIAAAHGLGFERALAAVTLDAARLLAVDDRIGSLEPGKDADLALWDGDPFEYTSHEIATIVDGVVVSRTVR